MVIQMSLSAREHAGLVQCLFASPQDPLDRGLPGPLRLHLAAAGLRPAGNGPPGQVTLHLSRDDAEALDQALAIGLGGCVPLAASETPVHLRGAVRLRAALGGRLGDPDRPITIAGLVEDLAELRSQR